MKFSELQIGQRFKIVDRTDGQAPWLAYIVFTKRTADIARYTEAQGGKAWMWALAATSSRAEFFVDEDLLVTPAGPNEPSLEEQLRLVTQERDKARAELTEMIAAADASRRVVGPLRDWNRGDGEGDGYE